MKPILVTLKINTTYDGASSALASQNVSVLIAQILKVVNYGCANDQNSTIVVHLSNSTDICQTAINKLSLGIPDNASSVQLIDTGGIRTDVENLGYSVSHVRLWIEWYVKRLCSLIYAGINL